MKSRKPLGLIINPVAGIGGRVGLKGSDGADIQRKAREMGAKPLAQERAIEALLHLKPLAAEIDLIAYPREMGEDAARACGFEPIVTGAISSGETTPQDTQHAAQAMHDMGAALILFAGGDGTARDVYNAVGDTVPVLGIPAGVKIHSAVYAINPGSAGELAAAYLRGDAIRLREAEVMDLDEDAYRQGMVSPRLYGYLKIPFQRRLVQARKSPSPLGEAAALAAIATDVIDNMADGVLYVVGPGTTTRPILTQLGLEKTLIGVDVVSDRRLAAADANEAVLLSLIEGHPAKIVVTPVGGQGYLFGRGNQQISPEVIRRVGRDNIIIVSTVEKITSLRGRPLLVDTGDRGVDQMLCGYVRIITGYDERIVYRIGAGLDDG
jgi:predicted polyphosphate/ATP-dependent NAD kinase